MELLGQIFDTTIATISDVLPIVTIIVFFQIVIIRRPVPKLKQTVIGFGYVLIGLTLFLVGLDIALFPLGKLMAKQLADPTFVAASVGIESYAELEWQHYYWLYLYAAAIGFATALAEPSVIAVATKANEVSGGSISIWGLRIAIATGAAAGITAGAFRIITGIPLHYLIIAAYMVVIIQTMVTPRFIIPLAYDSGGVTTSTVTVPIVTALGLGLATTIAGRSSLLDGFGIIATTCLFPIISVMAYAQITLWLTRHWGTTHRDS